ncbi:hypothetical protein BCD67_11990 [Oscillatoriales cyanobacterium USR001]|nr:hypothetical protein BCD67_11990 [Oscillatoriales cyanobacterium USR001]
MPLKNYGVLKGRPVGSRAAKTSNAHYQIHLVSEDTDYRIAINVQSKLEPSELEYLVDEKFSHPLVADLLDLPLGFNPVERKPGGLALDFIRGNLFDRQLMIPLPFDVPGPDNDLNEKIDKYVLRAIADENALIYAFGEKWGPESIKDKIFGFLPGNGIHDIHMNQGNVGKFTADDGVWQDGGMLIHFPSENRWVGIFLKFQSQTWHTDDVTGHRIESKSSTISEKFVDRSQEDNQVENNDNVVRIVAALVNPIGDDSGKETVTLLNTSAAAIDLTDWAIADKFKNKFTLSGTLAAGATLVINLPTNVQLSSKGGIITLLDRQGLKVHGVSYTQQQSQRQGWTIVF